MKLAMSILLSAATLAAAPAIAGTYAKTKYPIVLAHGMAGFDKIGPVDYWYGIPQDLASNGAEVHVSQVASFQSSEVRGEMFLAQVKNIMAITGAKKVNLIGHSHGNQSVRYVAGIIPSSVASVTSVGGVTKGSPIADMILEVTKIEKIGGPLTTVLTSVVNGFGQLIGLAAGERLSQDSLAGLNSLTTAGAADFNRRFPAGVPTSACGEGAYTVNGVKYYSWGGTSQLTNVFDIADGAMALTSLAFVGKADSQNDGFVGRCSNHLGKVLRDNYNMNHLDEVNQVLGLVSIFETNPKAVFRQHANRLKLAGM